jgi:signal transduction histidine kinase
VERGHARRFPGVGLGLTIARELALAMRGDIELESEWGKGTTVTLVMPIAEATVPPQPASGEPRAT